MYGGSRMHNLFRLFVVCVLLMLLIGCSKQSEDVKQGFSFEEASQIEMFSVDDADTVLHIVEKQEDVNAFVDALLIEKWELATLPEEVKPEHMYKLLETRTTTFGKAKKDTLIEVGTIISFQESPYIELNIKDFTLHFKIPQKAANFLAER